MRPDAPGTEQRPFEPDNGERLDFIGEHIVALISEPPSELADRVAAVGRKPPASGHGWHGWTRLGPRLYARAGLVGSRLRLMQVTAWACWRLFRRGLVEIATTPQKGTIGRLRWVRLVPTPAVPPTPHPWSVPRAIPEASRV